MNDGGTATPGRTVRRRKWSAIGFMLLLAVGLAWWSEQNIRIWASFELWRQMPLPDFDASKTANVSQEQRAEWEQELFAEVNRWNDHSRRYHGPSGTLERELRWRTMAEEGYELAHLALMVFEPSSGRMQRPLPALKRLDELARLGDAGAMCLYTTIAMKLPERGGIDWSPQKAQARFWMQKGAEIGHPACLIHLGARLQSGFTGFVQDVPRARAMLFSALRAGYLDAAGALWFFFENAGLSDPRNRRLTYCWGYQAAKIRYSDADLSLQVYLNEASPPLRQSLESELRDLRMWHPSLEECIELTNQSEGG